MSAQGYQTVERGRMNTLDYRIYFKDPTGKWISPWHDVPLFADEGQKIYNMIVEIPRWTNAKMEMATKEPLNPIRQDEKKGLPRFVHNIFPHRGYIWNYGALPQTWENPEHTDEHTKAQGDNDPIDVIEIGGKVHKRGAIVKVKIVGCLALLDEGETDWKLVAIDVEDPLAAKINSTADVEREMPGLLTATQEWFRIYKRPTGKPNNQFAFQGRFKDAEFTHAIIEQTHSFWQQFIQQAEPQLNSEANVQGAAHPADQEAWAGVVSSKTELGAAAEEPEEVQKWFFVQD